jgi:hypothetical protein
MNGSLRQARPGDLGKTLHTDRDFHPLSHPDNPLTS